MRCGYVNRSKEVATCRLVLKLLCLNLRGVGGLMPYSNGPCPDLVAAVKKKNSLARKTHGGASNSRIAAGIKRVTMIIARRQSYLFGSACDQA